MLAFALTQGGDTDEAIRVLRRLIEHFPSNADAWFNLGNLYRSQRRLEDAARAFRRAASLRPDDANPQINLAYVLVLLGKLDDAETLTVSSLKRFPNEPDLLANLAQIQRATYRRGEAIETLNRCLSLVPRHAGYLLTRAIVLGEAGEAKRALMELDALVNDDAANADARFARGQILLSIGAYAQGWRDYLWRPDRRRWLKSRFLAPDTGLPHLDRLRGRNVVLHGEQGLGDTLFFLRFMPALKTVAATVRLSVDPRLHEIPGAHWEITEDSGDVSLLVGDLPAVLGSTVEPSLKLEPDPARVASVRALLSQCGPPPWRGVTWRAGTPWEEMAVPGESLIKRVPAEVLGASLAMLDGTCVSLQRSPTRADMEAICNAAGRQVHDFSAVNRDLANALALLSLLDDYIAVSNTNVHLNEALGKPTRVLVTSPGEWRWSVQGERSPWMTHSQLYRQSSDGGWRDALARLQQDLDPHKKGRLGAPS